MAAMALYVAHNAPTIARPASLMSHLFRECITQLAASRLPETETTADEAAAERWAASRGVTRETAVTGKGYARSLYHRDSPPSIFCRCHSPRQPFLSTPPLFRCFRTLNAVSASARMVCLFDILFLAPLLPLRRSHPAPLPLNYRCFAFPVCGALPVLREVAVMLAQRPLSLYDNSLLSPHPCLTPQSLHRFQPLQVATVSLCSIAAEGIDLPSPASAVQRRRGTGGRRGRVVWGRSWRWRSQRGAEGSGGREEEE